MCVCHILLIKYSLTVLKSTSAAGGSTLAGRMFARRRDRAERSVVPEQPQGFTARHWTKPTTPPPRPPDITVHHAPPPPPRGNVMQWRRNVTISPAVAREVTLHPIQFLLQYWPSRSSKVDDFHFIWKSVCDFLLVINSNLGPISQSHRLATVHPLHTDILSLHADRHIVP